ncbi:S8 family peptidase [Rhizobacter sp. OV335]|uniref:S8 family peptidase n=1 Tax=Rhizobacter sp. OV335 TaxID=1500264 RepID=UPI000916C8E2|nr:S8 family peptidase [Rhizobacter sp. OV335]SHM08443.1 serine protease [Rhizobacter sp. OV335]
MKRLISCCIASLLALALAPAASAAEQAPTVRKIPAELQARVIVKFKADSSAMRALSVAGGSTQAAPQQAQTLSQRLGLALSDGHALTTRSQVVKASGLSSAELAARLSALSDVEYAVPDGRRRAFAAPNDPLYLGGGSVSPSVGQWYLRASTSSVVSAINAETAWAITTGSSSVVVAVLDTGIRPDHPELTNKLLPGYDFVSDAATANDGSGRDNDPSDPGDWITSAEDASGDFAGCGAEGSSWHGTQTAGLVGASTNNGSGMASIGRDVKLLPVRVLGKCGGDDSDIIAAMRWAAGFTVSGVPVNTNPAKVLSLSLGGSGTCSQAYKDAMTELTAAGVVVVAAAGNDGLAVNVPANCPGVVGVAGVRHTGSKVGFSSLGPELTIAAPAGNCVNTSGACLYPILTTTNTGSTTPGTSTYTDSANPSLGTSFSTPLVAGTLGLMFSADPALTPAQAISVLKSTARAFPTTGAAAGVVACHAPTATAQSAECYCTKTTCGAGLLDAGAAVAAVAQVVARIDTSSASTTAGSSVTFDGSGSSAPAGHAITGYQWALTAGSGIASFTSATNAATATVATTAAGSVTVSLTVTDDAAAQATSTASVTVNAATTPGRPGTPTTPATTPSTSSGDSGGGALGWPWLAGLLAAVLALQASSRARHRAARRQTLAHNSTPRLGA